MSLTTGTSNEYTIAESGDPMKQAMAKNREKVYEILFENCESHPFKKGFSGGYASFLGLSLNGLKKLAEILEDPFLDEKHNNAPSIREFIGFFDDIDGKIGRVKFNGYLISQERDDERVSIDAFEFDGPVTRDLIYFILGADDVQINEEMTRVWAWWD